MKNNNQSPQKKISSPEVLLDTADTLRGFKAEELADG